jgi:Ubiquitin-protein ligase
MKIEIKFIAGQRDALPVAHTWYIKFFIFIIFSFNKIDIVDYSSKEELRNKLLIAITEGKEGFYIR